MPLEHVFAKRSTDLNRLAHLPQIEAGDSRFWFGSGWRIYCWMNSNSCCWMTRCCAALPRRTH